MAATSASSPSTAGASTLKSSGTTSPISISGSRFESPARGGRRCTCGSSMRAAAAFAQGWPGYSVRASTDRIAWRMLPTRYADGILEFDWNGASELVWFAYFAPYTMDMHEALVARIAVRPGVTHRELGRSLDGQPIDALTIGGRPQAGLALRPPTPRRDDDGVVDGRRARLADEPGCGRPYGKGDDPRRSQYETRMAHAAVICAPMRLA